MIKKNQRLHKGKSIIDFPSEYVVIDIESTGLDPNFDDIIEVGALKISGGKIVSQYETLVKPSSLYTGEWDYFITELTGITPEMLINAPTFAEISNDFLHFVGNNTLVAHNANFDINFLYDFTDERLQNDFIDTLRLSRRILPDLRQHRLSDIAEYYKVSYNDSHRALADCNITYSCFLKLCSDILERFESYYSFIEHIKKKSHSCDAREITTSKAIFDTSHPLYNKNCAFTGTLELFPRKEAMQLVVDLGGICQNSVTAKTNFLILGNNDYCPSIKNGKSLKQKKAEDLKLKGNDIEIISENVFYDMIQDTSEGF